MGENTLLRHSEFGKYWVHAQHLPALPFLGCVSNRNAVFDVSSVALHPFLLLASGAACPRLAVQLYLQASAFWEAGSTAWGEPWLGLRKRQVKIYKKRNEQVSTYAQS
jgi:hypothetical protein